MHRNVWYQGADAPCGTIASRSAHSPKSSEQTSICPAREAIRAYPLCGARPATPRHPSRWLALGGLLLAMACAFPDHSWAQENENQESMFAGENALIAAPPDDMFIDIDVPAHQIYLGETMRIEYDVYAAIRRGNVDYHGEDPDFVNWYKIVAPPPRESQVSVNGKPYMKMPFDAYFVSPTKIGKISLPTIRVQVPYISTKPWITHAPRIIEVIPLPEPAPQGFAVRNVGKFTLQASFSETEVQIGDVVIATIELQSDTPVSGVQLAPYALTESASAFQLFPMKKVFIDENIDSGKLKSTLRFKLRMLALTAGNWTIDPFRIVTFDPEIHQYKTISTQPVTISVYGEGTVAPKITPRLHSAILDTYAIGPIHLEPTPYNTRIPVWCFLIAPIILIFLILITKIQKNILHDNAKEKQFKSLIDKLHALEKADSASTQNDLLCNILAEHFATPMRRKESELKPLLLHTFTEDDATFIVNYLHDLRLTSYSTKMPLDKERTSSLIKILKNTKPVEEDHA